jgi:hypothetical protein
LTDLALLRAAPGTSKKYVFDGSGGPTIRLRNEVALAGLEKRIYQGNQIQKLILDNLSVVEGPPTAKLIHLMSTHPPYMFDQFCNFIGVSKELDRAGMTAQSHCAIRSFLDLTAKMREYDVYDNTLIFLMADHGAGSTSGDDDLSSLYAQREGLAPGEFGRLIGGANPLLAIKYLNQEGPMKESLVSAQLTDIARTACEASNGCRWKYGLNLQNSAPQPRQRVFNQYRFKHKYWGLDHIPGMVRYKVTGPLWSRASWSRIFSDRMPELVTEVNFSSADEAELFGFGWGQVEVNDAGISKRWSTAEQAQLFLPLPSVEGSDLAMEFKVMSAPGVENQKMTVVVNGETVGSRELEFRVQVVSVTVPARLITTGMSEVLLQFSEILEPKNEDRRRISVSFFELKISRMQSQ